MDIIFFEKQDGRLCAQHCLNNLLQGSYFTAVDLAEIAQNLDASLSNDTVNNPHNQESQNFDNTGYFSLEVILTALKTLDLNLCLYSDDIPEAIVARSDPSSQSAYICHHQDHWYTIRKIGNQWFDLNSTKKRPELLSDTYLSLFLSQLLSEGNHVFLVLGSLPQCEADEYLKLNPFKKENVGTSVAQNEELQLQEAIKLSLETSKRAPLSDEELRLKRLKYFQNVSTS